MAENNKIPMTRGVLKREYRNHLGVTRRARDAKVL